MGSAASISHTSTFDLNVPIERLFPLFTPEGETLWVPGWTYENIEGSKELREDYIFLTQDHDHAAAKAVWITKQYDPGLHRVQYYKIEPDEKIGLITVQCTPLGRSQTKTKVTYRYIGLSESGNRFIGRFTKAEYDLFIAEWKRLLEKHFETEAL